MYRELGAVLLSLLAQRVGQLVGMLLGVVPPVPEGGRGGMMAQGGRGHGWVLP